MITVTLLIMKKAFRSVEHETLFTVYSLGEFRKHVKDLRLLQDLQYIGKKNAAITINRTIGRDGLRKEKGQDKNAKCRQTFSSYMERMS